MEQLGYYPDDQSVDTDTPSGVGNVACGAVLQFRHHDGSNQLGDLSASGVPYSDYTGFVSVNPPSPVPPDPDLVVDPNRWQPLQYLDATKTSVTQSFVGAQWYRVVPFTFRSGDEFRNLLARFGPATSGTKSSWNKQGTGGKDANRPIGKKRSGILCRWTELGAPPGHWDLFAQFVSARDHHDVDEDAKLFFALTNAIFDAGIVAWDAKRAFDPFVPRRRFRIVFRGRQIQAWGGPGKGTVTMDGRFWIPYQPTTFPTPPFPEFISGHSTFSAAGAAVLRLFTGSDKFGDSVTFPGVIEDRAGSDSIFPLTLRWETFTDAANEAGISRRYGGIHFRAGDLRAGRWDRSLGMRPMSKPLGSGAAASDLMDEHRESRQSAFGQ